MCVFVFVCVQMACHPIAVFVHTAAARLGGYK